jgi:hypothetical protein
MRCVLVVRAVAVLLAVFTLAFGGVVATTERPHRESAVLRASVQHHAITVAAIANSDPAPEAKRPDFPLALNLPALAGRWRILPAVVVEHADWHEPVPVIRDVRLPAVVVARGPPSC